jgi:hypothetical protein
MEELMIPIDQQIMLCDDRGELIMLASAMLASSRQIFLTNLGPESTVLLFEEVLDLLKEEKIVNMVKNKNARLKGPKKEGGDL